MKLNQLRFTDLLMLAHLFHQASWQYGMPSLLLGYDDVKWADSQPNDKHLVWNWWWWWWREPLYCHAELKKMEYSK